MKKIDEKTPAIIEARLRESARKELKTEVKLAAEALNQLMSEAGWPFATLAIRLTFGGGEARIEAHKLLPTIEAALIEALANKRAETRINAFMSAAEQLLKERAFVGADESQGGQA